MLRGPMNRSGKIHALLSTARVANIPSVMSNVWLGVMLGLVHGMVHVTASLWQKAGFLAVAAVLLYVGGNFFNDWMDRKWDARHRPERALPRGLFAPGLYAGLAAGLIGAGVTLAFVAGLRSGMVALGIAVAIVIYTLAHKRTAWAVVPMGICRGLLPL
ncbi:MAG TPA: UbiA family prenyltransferase, partial [Luteolibacter sp.]